VLTENLPVDFIAAYRAMTGKSPSRAAALAYAATDLALDLIGSSPDYRPDVSRLHALPLPPGIITNH